jgi:hypothetical protein
MRPAVMDRRRTDPAGARSSPHCGVGLAGNRSRPEGGSAHPGPCLGGHDDGPLRPSRRPEPLGRCGQSGRKHRGPRLRLSRELQNPGRGKWVLTWGFRWSRLSESNRRPSHYEEELRRRIGSLPAVLVTRPPPHHARFPMSIRDFVPRVMPRMSNTLSRAHVSVHLIVDRGVPLRTVQETGSSPGCA